ncbi:MAG: hypothetical protein LQ352_008190 [Teloschistes flavicans]|nr:MAG: hypothetical protein LQ352_008190 [Teloschistes flavicans]
MVQILGKDVGHTGFGMMGLTWRDVVVSKEQAFDVLTASIDNNATFWNGGEIYGTPKRNSLHLAAEYFAAHPEATDRVILSIKGAMSPKAMTIDCSRDNIRRSIDQCLRVLDGKKHLDIFEAGRVDPHVPLEETINAIAEYVSEGKVGGIGLSEVDAATIRQAHAVHPIAAVEVELSLQTPDILTNGVAQTCGELGIPIVAYSPLGRGLLTGDIKSAADFAKGDVRLRLPRFFPDALEKNAATGAELRKMAEGKGCTAAQVAIAWTRAWSGREGVGEVLPIPGATRVERVVENSKAVGLTEAEWEVVEEIRKREVIGARYPDWIPHVKS